MFNQLFTLAYYTFVALIVALGVLLFVSSFSGSLVGVKVVQSGSMEPRLPTGSIVVIYQTKNYDVGDIITFFFSPRDTVPTTHRIVDVEVGEETTTYITKGDANENEDPRPIPESAIIGELLFSVPFVGYVLDFAKRPIGFAIIIGIPALLVIFDEGAKIYREVQLQRKNELASREDSDDDTTS